MPAAPFLPERGRFAGLLLPAGAPACASRALRVVRCLAQRCGATFRCTLKASAYRYYVYATDAAGNHQARVAWSTLTVK